MVSEQGWSRVRGVARRRKWAILVATAIGFCAALPLAFRVAPGFRAQAVVRAIESQPAHEYVAPTVGEPMGERMKTLRVAAMARPLVAEVVAELGLAAALGRAPDAVVDDVRSRVEVKVEGEDTFLLSYEDRDPARAQAVVNALARRFMAHQVERRAEIAAATRRALESEVAALRPSLHRLESSVRDFKIAHYGSLPEQQEENLRTLDQTTMEINIASQAVDLANEHRRQLLGGMQSPLRHQEDQLASALHDARAHYNPAHPEVRRIEAELAEVRRQRIADERAAREGAKSPELDGIEREIARGEARLQALRDRQAAVRARVADTARNGEALLALATDLDVVKAKYQAALGRLHEAELAGAVEKQLAGLRYELVEGASRPRNGASAPNRAFWLAAALAFALALGVGVGFALDFADTTIHSPEEIAAALGDGAPPVLACVPAPARSERRPLG